MMVSGVQVSLAAVGEDKFSRLLQSTHNLATILLEVSLPPSLLFARVCLQVALAADISKHVEELMSYFTVTFQVDPSGALLCVQQVGPQLVLTFPNLSLFTAAECLVWDECSCSTHLYPLPVSLFPPF